MRLFDSGTNINSEGYTECTALMRGAAVYGIIEIGGNHLERGADGNASDVNGMRHSSMCWSNESAKVIALLESHTNVVARVPHQGSCGGARKFRSGRGQVDAPVPPTEPQPPRSPLASALSALRKTIAATATTSTNTTCGTKATSNSTTTTNIIAIIVITTNNTRLTG